MAVIHNPNRTLRFSFDLVDLSTKDQAFIATAAVEFFDKRDQDFWPMLRLPVVRMSIEDGAALVNAIRDVCSQSRPGFSFRTGVTEELQLNVLRDGPTAAIEIGMDLSAYLKETTGISSPAGRELALFRFDAGLTELVVFGDALASKQSELKGRVVR
jgi:hypothetical protein